MSDENSSKNRKQTPYKPPLISGWQIGLRIVWGILGIPVALFLFALLITLMFPFGGGIAHIMFAYSPGGNIIGARYVFVGFLLATALVTYFLRLTRYPLPWYGTAVLVSAIALWLWQPVISSDASNAFRLQALLLSPLLPATAFAGSFYFRRQQR